MIKYTPSHEWISSSGDIATIGITEYAQKELGQVVYIDLPSIGKVVSIGEEIAVLESTKAAADIYSPASGEVVAINEELKSDLSSMNAFPETLGWLCKIKIKNRDEVEELLSREEYLRMIES